MILQNEFPYHVTDRCINREWFDLPLDIVWREMENQLYLVCQMFELRVHAFVLMANHFHLLVSTPNSNVSAAMQYFMRETSRAITTLTGRINQTYGARHHKTVVSSYHYFMNAYKYVYNNPVRAGSCHRAEHYRFSTLHGLCGLAPIYIPLCEDTILFCPTLSLDALEWINCRPSDEEVECVRRALKHRKMTFAPNRSTGRASELEKRLI